MLPGTKSSISQKANTYSIANVSRWKNIKKDWRLYVLILPPIILLVIFSYIPMVGVLMAFQDFNFRKGLLGSPWVGLKYFKIFIESPLFAQLIFNTFILSIYSLVAGFFCPIILAIVVNELRNNMLKKTVQMVTYAPYFISTVVMVGMLMQFLAPRTGFVNQILSILGIGNIDFIGNSGLFRHIHVWSGVWQNTGYSAIIYIAALSGINQEIYQAAMIDGATKFQRLRNIDIPGIAPTIIILLILSMANILNVGFEKVFIMQNPVNLGVSEVISTYVYKVGLQQSQYGFSAAVGLFNSLVNFVLLVIVNYISKAVSDNSLW